MGVLKKESCYLGSRVGPVIFANSHIYIYVYIFVRKQQQPTGS